MGNKIRIKQIDLQGVISASAQIDLTSASNYVSFVTQLNTTMSSDAELIAVSSSISESIYTINQTLQSGLISGSSQLTQSYDSRYVLSGSITQTTWDNISGKPSGLVSESTDLSSLNSFTESIDSRVDSLESWSSSLDDTFATDLQVSIVSSSVAATIGVISQNTGLLSTSSFNEYTASQSTASLVSRLDVLESNTGSYLTSLNGTISGSSQLTSSYDERYVLSGSITQTIWDNIDGKPNDIVSSSSQITALGFISSSDSTTALNEYTSSLLNAFQVTGSRINFLGDIVVYGTQSVISSTNVELSDNILYLSPTASTDNDLGIVGHYNDGTYRHAGIFMDASDGHSWKVFNGLQTETTATVDTNGTGFTLADFKAGVITGTSFNGVINATNGVISGSSQLTSSYDDRYALSASYLTSLNGAISSSIQVLGGSGVYSSSAQLPIGLISGSSQITSSFDTRYTLSGSVQPLPSGLISGSSQLTSSYDSRYSLSGSVLTSFSSSVDNRLDTLEASIISGSINYTQVLSDKRSGITTTGSVIISGSITTSGNPVQIMVTGDANPVAVGASYTRLQIYRDSNPIGNIIQVENSQNLNVPYCLNVIDTPPAGTYQYSMRTVSIFTGTFDFGEHNGPLLTAVELKSNTQLPSGLISGSSQLPSGLISGSSQLTSSYDTRYTLSGSVSSTPAGTISGSSQLTSSFDGRYVQTGSFNAFTASALTTGSNSFNGNQTITGSLIVSSVAVVNGAVTIPTDSTISLTSGSSIFVDSSGAITGSLTGSIFGIGDVSAFSSSVNTRLNNITSTPTGTISGSSQLTSSFEVRGSGIYSSSAQLPSGLISGSSQLTSSYDSRYTLTSSFNSFTASAQAVTTGSNTFNGTQTITGSLNITNGNIVASQITANTASLYLTSGSNLIVQNNGLVEITGSLVVSGSVNIVTTSPLQIGTGSGDEGGEILLAKSATNSTLTGSGITIDSYRDRLRIFEQGGDARGVYIDLAKTPTGVSGELIWKASGMVNAGTFVTLDNIKATVTSSGNRGLSIAAVSTNFSANISAYYAMNGGVAGTATNNFSVTTTPTSTLFTWNFTAEGDGAYYTIVDKTNNRMYRVTLMIGASYNNNFISIERLY